MSPHNFTPKCLCLDIETAVADVFEIHKLAAWRPDTGKSLSLNGRNIAAWMAQLDQLTDGAAFVLGHNVRRHDLPVLLKLFPDLGLHALPVVDTLDDTLELSPVAFPQNPYHSVVLRKADGEIAPKWRLRRFSCCFSSLADFFFGVISAR